MQKDKPVAYAPRVLNATQQGYSVIENERLALGFGTQKFHQYLYGRSFIVESAHKLLENRSSNPLFKGPPRLVGFILQLQKYDFVAKYQPGRNLYLLDTLFRLDRSETSECLAPEVVVNEPSINLNYMCHQKKYKHFQDEFAKNSQLQTL